MMSQLIFKSFIHLELLKDFSKEVMKMRSQQMENFNMMKEIDKK